MCNLFSLRCLEMPQSPTRHTVIVTSLRMSSFSLKEFQCAAGISKQRKENKFHICRRFSHSNYNHLVLFRSTQSVNKDSSTKNHCGFSLKLVRTVCLYCGSLVEMPQSSYSSNLRYKADIVPTYDTKLT